MFFSVSLYSVWALQSHALDVGSNLCYLRKTDTELSTYEDMAFINVRNIHQRFGIESVLRRDLKDTQDATGLISID